MRGPDLKRNVQGEPRQGFKNVPESHLSFQVSAHGPTCRAKWELKISQGPTDIKSAHIPPGYLLANALSYPTHVNVSNRPNTKWPQESLM
jgi:hypothetical protein